MYWHSQLKQPLRLPVWTYLLVLVFTLTQLFAGWPQIFNFPPKIQPAQAATITKIIDRQLSVSTATNTWTQKATITLAQNGSWLILTSFEFGIDNTTNKGEVRLQKDQSLDLQEGILENMLATESYKNWFWMTRVERTGANVVLDLDFINQSTSTSRIRNVIILALLLNDMGTEDTDWRWQDLSLSGAEGVNLGTDWTNASNILLTEIWTPSTTEDWLIIANLQIKANATNTNAEARLSLNDEASIYDTSSEEGEDLLEYRWWSSLRLLTLLNSEQKFEVQARSDAQSNSDAKNVRFFAVRKAVFDQMTEPNPSDSFTSPAAADTWYDKVDASFTPNQSEDVLILSHVNIAYADDDYTSRTYVDENEGGTPNEKVMYNDCEAYDNTDISPVALGDIVNWDTSTLNADLSINASNTGVTFGNARVIFVSLTLASAIPLGVTSPTDVTLTSIKPSETGETTFSDVGELVIITDGGSGWSLTVQVTTTLEDISANTIPDANVYIRKDGNVNGAPSTDVYTIWSGVTTNVTEVDETVPLDTTAKAVGVRSSGTGDDITNVRPTIRIVADVDQTPSDYDGILTFTVI